MEAMTHSTSTKSTPSNKKQANNDEEDDDHLDDPFFVGTLETHNTDSTNEGLIWGNLPQHHPMATQTRSKQQDFDDPNEDVQNIWVHGPEAWQHLERGRNNTDAGGGEASHTLAGAPTRPPTISMHYSGIGHVIEKGGRRLNDDRFITTELNWKNQVSSNKEKQKGFQEKVLQSPGFWPFLFMTKGSHFMRMGHSIAKYASVTQSDQELDGKVITFVGDRCARQELLAVILPQKAWTWATHKVYSKANEMVTFYANNRNYLCFHESQADQNSQAGHPILDV